MYELKPDHNEVYKNGSSEEGLPALRVCLFSKGQSLYNCPYCYE